MILFCMLLFIGKNAKTVLSEEIISETECVTIRSEISDETASVTCPSEYTLLSCGIDSLYDSFDGTWIDDNTCYASSSYELILKLKKWSGSQLFDIKIKSTGNENDDNPGQNTFSKIGNINKQDYILSDGKYQFKLIYEYNDGSEDILIWKQSSWLTQGEITGYEPIDIPSSTLQGCFKFNGLGLSNSAGNRATYLDGNGNKDCWWNAVGPIDTGTYNGIPAFNQQFAIAQTLYIYKESDIQAVARCCKLHSSIQCTDVEAEGYDYTNEDTMALIACPSQLTQVITSCTTYGIDQHIFGNQLGKFSNNIIKCIASAAGEHYAQARCCSYANNNVRLELTGADSSWNGSTSVAEVGCPSGYFLSGCMGFTTSFNLESWYITSGETCHTKHEDGILIAISICLREVIGPQNIDYSSMDFGDVQEIIDQVTDSDIVESIECDTTLLTQLSRMTIDSTFFDDIMQITTDETMYNALYTYILSYPTFYDEEECEVDAYLKQQSSWTGDESSDQIEYLLSKIYSSISEYITTYSNELTSSERNTAISITYSIELCLDLAFEFCYSYGFGFAFNFNSDVIYYTTGSQGLTMGSSDDLGILLPGSVNFAVSYDILTSIDAVPGNSYSLDIGVSTGMLIEFMNEFQNYIQFIQSDFSFSYLVGVDSLALSDVDTYQCIGYSFSKSLTTISGSVIPSGSFGISRGATVLLQDLGENDQQCISEQLFSIDFGIIRPDIEL